MKWRRSAKLISKLRKRRIRRTKRETLKEVHLMISSLPRSVTSVTFLAQTWGWLSFLAWYFTSICTVESYFSRQLEAKGTTTVSTNHQICFEKKDWNKQIILVINSGIDVTDPNTDVTDPYTDVTDPNTDVTDPNREVTDPNREVTDPNTDVTDPNTDVTDPNTEIYRRTDPRLQSREYKVNKSLRSQKQRDIQTLVWC